MTELEQTLADTILIQANNLSHDTKVVLRMTQAYQTLQDAVATRVRSVNYHNAYVKLQSQSTPLWGCGDAEPSVCTTPLWVCPEEEAPAPPETAVTDAKPKRTRRTKEQIAADEAAAAAATAEVASEPASATEEPVAELDSLDDDLADEPEPEVPTITRGQVQELFTHKLKVIGAGGVAPVNAFKGKVRELLAKYEAPGGVSTVPDANLVAFHAELANLA
jgi:hypothetical protein